METVILTIRFPADLYEALRLEAFQERTSMNAIVIQEVRERYADPEHETYRREVLNDRNLDSHRADAGQAGA